MFMKDNDSASSVVSSLPPCSYISAKIVKKEYLEIIWIDKGFDESNITGLVNSLVQENCFGSSLVVQLSFKSQKDLDKALKYGNKIDYSFFWVSTPLNRPKQCYRFQGFDNFARECVNALQCGKCARPNVNNHDNACSASTVKY